MSDDEIIAIDQERLAHIKAAADPWQTALAKALADVKAKLDASSSGKRAPLFSADAVELLARHFDGARWLISGLVTRLGITMIGAEPKAAKTWLALELALGVATGSKVCGEFYAEHGRAAYFFAEDLDVQVRNRVRALMAGANRRIETGRLFLQPRGTFIDVLVDEDLAWLIASCRMLGSLDLLVLDPLRDVHDGEEDKSDSMRNVMRRLRVLADIIGCTVAVVHHAPKLTKENSARRAGQNLRGSSAIHGSVDSGIYLTESAGDGTNTFTNTITSQVKGARSAGKFKLELRVTDNAEGEAVDAKWTFSRGIDIAAAYRDVMAGQQGADDEAAVLAFVITHQDPPRSKTWLRDQFKAIGVPAKRTRDALERLIEAGQARLSGGYVVAVQNEEHTDNATR